MSTDTAAAVRPPSGVVGPVLSPARTVVRWAVRHGLPAVCPERGARRGDPVGRLLRNRSVREHPGPARFDVARANARDHLAFSAGIHYCRGAGLAHLEAVVGLRNLGEGFAALRVSGAPVRRDLQTLRGFEHLPVVLR